MRTLGLHTKAGGHLNDTATLAPPLLPSRNRPQAPMKPPLLRTRLMAWAVLVAAILAGILFLIAGSWDLPMLWAYVGVVAILMINAMAFVDLGLIKERLRPGPGGRDRWVLYVLKLLFWSSLILAAVDVGRTGWSDTVPPTVQAVALLGFAAGFGLAISAMIVNRFFSTVVRLQTDRGHHLITAGPYRVVRHPGYAGIVVGCLCSPLALGSWLATIPMLPCVALFVRRTLIEDRFLQEHLDGYADYAGRVRYRLLPGVW